MTQPQSSQEDYKIITGCFAKRKSILKRVQKSKSMSKSKSKSKKKKEIRGGMPFETVQEYRDREDEDAFIREYFEKKEEKENEEQE